MKLKGEFKNVNPGTKQEQDLKMNSVHYYLKSDSDHIFVRNNSDKLDPLYKKRSVIIIPITPDKTIRVAAMKAPQDLTEQATKEEILKSQAFMDSLRKKHILICTDEEAYEERLTEEAQREIAKYEANANNSSLDEILSRKEIKVVNITEQQEREESARAVGGINPSVLDCLVRDDITPEEKVLVVKEMAEVLERKDWQYILIMPPGS